METALLPLGALLLPAPLAGVHAVDGQLPTATSRIDRHALVARHSIKWNELGGQIPLGNGEFCFNADGLGLQTFGGNSLSHWGWHSWEGLKKAP